MRKNIRLISLFLLLLICNAVQAARIDTLRVHAPKMNRDIDVVVIVPEGLKTAQKIPTLYLLHGHGDNEYCWLRIKPELKEMVDRDQILVVCPDGENSWYWDSPLHADSQFETFVAKELTAYIDAHYPTIPDRKGRAITGLSMGGHGALWLSFHHKDVFGAAGSTSGGVDIRPFPKSWNLAKQLGEEKTNQARWDAHTVMTQLDLIKNGDLALIIDCGSDDFFHEVNCKFHEALLKRGIFHDFTVRPGLHNRRYWNNSLDYQWLFFRKFFAGYRHQLEL